MKMWANKTLCATYEKRMLEQIQNGRCLINRFGEKYNYFEILISTIANKTYCEWKEEDRLDMPISSLLKSLNGQYMLSRWQLYNYLKHYNFNTNAGSKPLHCVCFTSDYGLWGERGRTKGGMAHENTVAYRYEQQRNENDISSL